MSFPRIAPIIALGFFLSASASAQRRQTQTPGEVRITISYENHSTAPNQLRVELLNGVGNLVAQKISDRSGRLSFTDVAPGTYHLQISAPEIEEYVGDAFTMFDSGGTHFETVLVKFKMAARQQAAREISSADLAVPDKARSEYTRGMDALRKGENADARMRFEKAIQIYPGYGAAYNNLGVMAMNAGDPQGGEENFKKAVIADPKYAGAYVNMSKIKVQQGKPADAKALLQTATQLDGSNLEALMLLANASIATNDFDLAIASVNKLHGLPKHEQYGVAHFLAAEALERKGEPAKALAEYQMFLQETPTSSLADTARKNIASLERMSNPRH
jgi:tetratricopeptide (TPR) repeat protein